MQAVYLSKVFLMWTLGGGGNGARKLVFSDPISVWFPCTLEHFPFNPHAFPLSLLKSIGAWFHSFTSCEENSRLEENNTARDIPYSSVLQTWGFPPVDLMKSSGVEEEANYG